jgi:hypothetical protein
MKRKAKKVSGKKPPVKKPGKKKAPAGTPSSRKRKELQEWMAGWLEQKAAPKRKAPAAVKKRLHKKTNEVKRGSTVSRSKVVDSVRELSKLQEQLGKKIKQPKRELDKVKKELSRQRSKLYRLTKKQKSIRGRGAKAKRAAIEKQKKKLIKEMTPVIKRRSGIRSIMKIKDKMNRYKHQLARDRDRISKLADKADEERDYVEFGRLMDEQAEIADMMDATMDAMDEAGKAADLSSYAPYHDELEDGFVLRFTLPIWEAQEQLDKDISNGLKIFIINGMKIGRENSGMAVAEMAALRQSLSAADSDELDIDIYYNDKYSAVKYESKK